MKNNMKRLMIYSLVLLGAALFMSTSASAVIIGTAPAAVGGTTIVGPVMPIGVMPSAIGFPPGLVRPPLGLSPGLVRPPLGIPPGLVRPSIFNPFLLRPAFNPFLIHPVFNPFLDIDIDVPLGLGLNPGLAD